MPHCQGDPSEPEAAQQPRAPGGTAPGATAEGEAEGPAADKGGWGGAPKAAGIGFLMAEAQAWHAQAEAAAGHMSAVVPGLRMAPQSEAPVDVATTASNLAKVTTAHDQPAQQTPPQPPHGGGDARRLRGGAAKLPALRWPELSSTWGFEALPLTSGPPVPYNLHECNLYVFIYEYMYIQVLPAPPARPPSEGGMGSLKDM